MAIIDLSGPIYEGMWTYGPPLPEVRIRQVASLEKEGWDAHYFHFGNIQGTCIESPSHYYIGSPSIDQYSLEQFLVRAAVLQLPDKQAKELITVREIIAAESEAKIEPGMAVLIATGWDRMWDNPRFYWDSPHFTRPAVEWIISKQPSIVGVDISSIDDPKASEGLLKMIFASNVLLLAPLVNLRKITHSHADLIALPLPIRNVCGTPVRAVAIEE